MYKINGNTPSKRSKCQNHWYKLRKFFGRLGPGFITGAADDDPSGIATYSIAGAQFGYRLNWLTIFLLPLMISVQEMCGRIGMVSGRGLAGNIKKFYSKKLLFLAITLLFIANTINIGADLGIMAASLQMILGQPFIFWLILVTIFTVLMQIFIPYNKYCYYLRYMALSLLVYVITALIVKQDLWLIIKSILIPHIELNINYLMTMVGFLGTTISPYLFFWQAAEETEHEIAFGKIHDFEEKHWHYKREINEMKKDTSIGMFFSEFITFFIVLTTAATLHKNGITNIETPQQAALALKPLAGNLAYLLFTVGIIGIGLQSIPVLSGGLGYAFSEIFNFKMGLSKKLTEAKFFYLVIALSTILGVLVNFVDISIMKLLYYTAIINGIVAVPLIFIIIKMADNEKIVGHYKSSFRRKFAGYIAFFFMAIACCLMIINLLNK